MRDIIKDEGNSSNRGERIYGYNWIKTSGRS